MTINENPAFTYLEVVCEARVNNTEKIETIENILSNFLIGEKTIDHRFDGKYLIIRNSEPDGLQIFAEWVREARQLDTIRKRLFRSIVGNLTGIYFNRQAAAMGRLALLDLNDNPPLGPISLHIVSDSIEAVIDIITPKTLEGKELSSVEWERERKMKEYEKKKKLMMKKKLGKS